MFFRTHDEHVVGVEDRVVIGWVDESSVVAMDAQDNDLFGKQVQVAERFVGQLPILQSGEFGHSVTFTQFQEVSIFLCVERGCLGEYPSKDGGE